MSTYWGLLCRSCDVSTGCALNHGEGTLAAFWAARAAVAELQRCAFGVTIDLVGSWDRSPVDFVIEHADHDVVLWNEYGDQRPIDAPRAQPLR